jgi:hypothetical protein
MRDRGSWVRKLGWVYSRSLLWIPRGEKGRDEGGREKVGKVK